jgi:pyrroline-5-carboxylate reductase
MCAAWGPGHLLLLAEALADHLIHRGFHKARAYPFAVPVALAIVGNEANGIKLSPKQSRNREVVEL